MNPTPAPHPSRPRTLAILNHRGERLGDVRSAFQDRGWEVHTSRDLESSLDLLKERAPDAALVAPLTLRPENLEWVQLLEHLSPRVSVPWLVGPWNEAPTGSAGPLLRGRGALADWIPSPVDEQEADSRLQNLMRLQGLLAENEARARALEDQLVVDHKTGLFNDRHFRTRFQEEFERTVRHRSPVSFLLLDLDDFKSINDRHGYEFADLALRSFAELLMRTCRTADIVGRFGGDEFEVLLPDTGLADCMVVAKRIQDAARRRPVTSEDAILHLRISMGISTYAGGGDLRSPRELFTQAEEALKHAKQTGKDRIAFFDPRLRRVSGEEGQVLMPQEQEAVAPSAKAKGKAKNKTPTKGKAKDNDA